MNSAYKQYPPNNQYPETARCISPTATPERKALPRATTPTSPSKTRSASNSLESITISMARSSTKSERVQAERRIMEEHASAAAGSSGMKSIEIQTGSLFAHVHRGKSIFCQKGQGSNQNVCRPTKFVMFQLSGAIGMILFYLAWSDLFYRMKDIEHGPVISWCSAYGCSILWQHLLNRKLVFTDVQQGYWESLGGMCLVYLFTLILSSVLNVLFVEVLNIAANFAFFVTAVFTGAVNYVAINKCVAPDEQGHYDEEDEEIEDKDIVVDLAMNMVSGIQLPTLEMPMPQVELWGQKIKQKAKHWSHHGA